MGASAWRASRIVRGAASAALATVIVVVAVPHAGGVGWREIGAAVAALSLAQVALLAGVWLAGLWVHTLALTAAMPGLSSRRALFLNLTGSSVSNLLPLGGAAGTAVNYSTSRSWGFSPSAFARWALVTNIWDTLVKLALPGLALCWLALEGLGGGGLLGRPALAGAGLLLLMVFGVRTLIRGEKGARALGRAADRLARLAGKRPPVDGGYAAWAVRLRTDSAALIASSWARLTLGKAAYALLQAALLWLCLASLGTAPAPAVVFAAFALERLLSMAVITPGATGIVEVGMTGLLVALGSDAVTAAAGVLVYRAITVGLEIPVGGAGLLWWMVRQRPPARTAALV